MKAYQINIPAYVVLFQGVAYVVRDECPGLTFGFIQEDISILQNNIDLDVYYTPLALDEVFLIACLENIKADHPHQGTRDLAAAMLEACAAGDTSARVASKVSKRKQKVEEVEADILGKKERKPRKPKAEKK